MRESVYQSHVIRELRRMFPGCVILKNDSGYMQGVPDLSMFHGRFWAMLETKRSRIAKEQPNQDYWVDFFNNMSFAAFIHPENEAEILDALQRAYESDRDSRVS